MVNVAILTGVALVSAILMWPRLAHAPLWRATITPLASIIGSGFLVLGPIMDVSYGAYAPLVMASLCLLAYLFGWTIRYNIQTLDQTESRPLLVEYVETAASACLAFAYVISVSYYLNLFGVFGIRLTALEDSYHAKLLTTAVFLLILMVGWSRGFSAMERLEQVTVGLNLSIIMGLLIGLAFHFAKSVEAHALVVHPPTVSGWPALMLAAGLIVTVQGFETTRYLGKTYTAVTRIRAMKIAQWVSAAIYIIYIGLLTYAFETKVMTLQASAIIDLMNVVAPILPALLVGSALSAQFSAAAADTSGSGGLIGELTRGWITQRLAYLVIVSFGIGLTWSANVFEIISYASRAFAAYYALQACIAALSARTTGAPARAMIFGIAAGLAAFAAIFGKAAE